MKRCERCGQIVMGTASDPAISAPSLGKGVFHFECARRKWQGSTDTQPPTQDDDIDCIADVVMGLVEGGKR